MVATVAFRRATIADSYATFELFRKSLVDFMSRTGTVAAPGGTNPEEMARMWEFFGPVYDHLARTGEHFWIAERDGKAIGYARGILRDGVRELTEFFVLPGEQSAGVGRELLARVFPTEGARHRVLVATSDPRALARYLKAGVYPHVSTYGFTRTPEALKVSTDLQIDRVAATPEALDITAAIDREILGYRRDVDHAWLLERQMLFVCRRRGKVAGYGYVSKDWCGPIALLDEADFSSVLAHMENRAHALGAESVELEVPLVNRNAVDYLLRRGYRMEGWLASIMSDVPFGRFDRYIGTSPPFFL